MKITYLKHQTDGEGSFQSIPLNYVIREVLPLFDPSKSKYEHLAWIGVVENRFLEDEISIFAIVQYSGNWDSRKITDEIIRDIVDPKSTDPYPSPFAKYYKDRKQLTESLKGDIIY